MTIIGLSAPATFASPHSPRLRNCSVGHHDGPFHLNLNGTTLGLTYHGPGNPMNITSSPGDSTLVCAVSSGIYYIRNNAGNCIRMRDASAGYSVLEESGCQLGNTNYEFLQIANNGLFSWENIHFKQFLGVIGCPGTNGDPVVGVQPVTGNCLAWHEVTP